MQIYGHLEEMYLQKCIVWVGNIITLVDWIKMSIFLSPAAAKSTAELSKHRRRVWWSWRTSVRPSNGAKLNVGLWMNASARRRLTFLSDLGCIILLIDQKSGKNPVEVGSRNPIIYKVLAPSKQWLALGFLNHQRRITLTNHLIGLLMGG